MKPHPILDPEAGIYLALGGGAARGFAHLGVLMALKHAKIPIAGICGTSMGALVGACYALSLDPEQLILHFRDYIKGPEFHQKDYSFIRKNTTVDAKPTLKDHLVRGLLFGKSYATGGVISFDEFQEEVRALLPDKTFNETIIPFFATAVDLTQIREVVFNQGYLRSAVLASSAIPGAFPAIQSEDSVYVDGGWMNRVPVNPLFAFGARQVLAVDVSDASMPDEVNPKRGIAVLQVANKATRERLHEMQLERATHVWKIPLQDVNWADFFKIDQIIELGMMYAEEHMHELYPLLDPPAKIPWWRKLARRLADNEPPPPQYNFDVRPIWEVQPAEHFAVRDES